MVVNQEYFSGETITYINCCFNYKWSLKEDKIKSYKMKVKTIDYSCGYKWDLGDRGKDKELLWLVVVRKLDN